MNQKKNPEAASPLSACAARALTEAAARAAALEEKARSLAAQEERGGRGGLDPVRYDDWEIKGIARDF